MDKCLLPKTLLLHSLLLLLGSRLFPIKTDPIYPKIQGFITVVSKCIYSKTCSKRNRMGPRFFSTLDNFPHYGNKITYKQDNIKYSRSRIMYYRICICIIVTCLRHFVPFLAVINYCSIVAGLYTVA